MPLSFVTFETFANRPSNVQQQHLQLPGAGSNNQRKVHGAPRMFDVDARMQQVIQHCAAQLLDRSVNSGRRLCWQNALAYSFARTVMLIMPLCRRIHVLDAHANFAPLLSLPGHSSTVRSIDWSCDGAHLMSVDQAYETLHFDVKKGCTSRATHRDTKWASWTNILGFPVMGIWPPGSDGTDINAVDRAPDGQSVLTCDDSGKVLVLHSLQPVRRHLRFAHDTFFWHRSSRTHQHLA
jgi:hypothetical protein